MKVLVSKTLSSVDITYGKRFQTEVENLDNVTSITEVTESNVLKYAIVHQNSGDVSPVTSKYPVDSVVLSIYR